MPYEGVGEETLEQPPGKALPSEEQDERVQERPAPTDGAPESTPERPLIPEEQGTTEPAPRESLVESFPEAERPTERPPENPSLERQPEETTTPDAGTSENIPETPTPCQNTCTIQEVGDTRCVTEMQRVYRERCTQDGICFAWTRLYECAYGCDSQHACLRRVRIISHDFSCSCNDAAGRPDPYLVLTHNGVDERSAERSNITCRSTPSITWDWDANGRDYSISTTAQATLRVIDDDPGRDDLCDTWTFSLTQQGTFTVQNNSGRKMRYQVIFRF